MRDQKPTIEEISGWMMELSEWFKSIANMSGMTCTNDLNLKRAKLWYDRAAQVEEMGWRPIEEAPKDERVLLWAEGWYAPNTGEWAKTGFSPDGYCEWAHQPTHFRPNVEPPVKK